MSETPIGPEAQKLREYYQRKAAEGLVDVKFATSFFVGEPPEGLTVETLCAEVNRLNEAIERGETRPFSFNDSHLR